MIVKMKFNLLPNYLTEKLMYVRDVHNYVLRNSTHFRLSSLKNKKIKNMILYNGLKLFNSLLEELKSTINIKNFKG